MNAVDEVPDSSWFTNRIGASEMSNEAVAKGFCKPGPELDPEAEDGSWLIDGVMPVAELKARLDIKDLPEESRGRYNTVAGLLQSVSGRLLMTGEKVECAGWTFEVVDLDGKRIDKVLAAFISETAPP